MVHAATFLHHILVEPAEHFGDWQGPGWYFVDESESRLYGPYLNEEAGREARDDYFKSLHGKKP